MNEQLKNYLTRREFLRYAAGLGISASGIALLDACGIQPAAPTAEPRLETTKLVLRQAPTICFAPLYLAEEFLRAEGFTDVQYPNLLDVTKALASGEVDLTMNLTPQYVINADAGDPITVLAGIH